MHKNRSPISCKVSREIWNETLTVDGKTIIMIKKNFKMGNSRVIGRRML